VRWRIIGLVGGALLLVLAYFVIAAGNQGLADLLLVAFALVVLVAGGNWLNDWMGIKRKAQEFNRPDSVAKEPDER
jgi:hypothetical protein